MKLRINDKKINSLIIAIILLSNTIAMTLSLGFGITSNANFFVLLILFFLIGLKCFIKGIDSISVKKETIFLFGMVMALFIFSKCFMGEKVQYSIVQLLFYAILPIICIGWKCDTKYVCQYAMYISLFTILGGNNWFDIKYSFINQVDMGTVYPIVTMLIFAIFHFRYYRKDKDTNWLIWLCYIYNAYMLVRITMVANRGAILTLLFAVFVAFLYDFKKNGSRKSTVLKQKVIWGIVLVFIVIVLTNLSHFIDSLAVFFESVLGSTPSFILKMQRYISLDDIFNGRDNLYKILFEAIKGSPFFGYGMETFQNYTKGEYPFPHNFILQFLFEGGILFATIPIVLAVIILFKILFGRIKNKETYILAAILVCQCYPKLLLSTDAWKETALWMMIAWSALLLNKMGYKKKDYLLRRE